jgi:hypothetical protein
LLQLSFTEEMQKEETQTIMQMAIKLLTDPGIKSSKDLV